MHLLITGPAASGKSRLALERFHATPGSRLIVPAATMAEHLRHQMARDGLPVRPNSVQTLGQLVDQLDGVPGEVPAPLLVYVTAREIEQMDSRRWAAVADLPGFHRAAAHLIEEAPAAGLRGEWGELLARVDRRLALRGLARRNLRLRAAAADVNGALAPLFVFDGFFSFSPGESEFIVALTRRAAVTVTLPRWPGSASALERLAGALGAPRVLSEVPRRKPEVSIFPAPKIEREVEEIARAILKETARGALLREIGIVLRAREPYAAELRATLDRFGIPARFYFTDPLPMHPAVMFLSGVIRAMVNGWDRDALLSAVRMPVSGLGATAEGDRLDFDWRAQLPAFGLPHSLSHSEGDLFAKLAACDRWRREQLTAEDWAQQFRSLRALIPLPRPRDQAPADWVGAWRSTAAALRGLDEALDAASAAFADAGPMGLGVFWQQVEDVLALEPLRVADRQRDRVHVLDVYEARQWELRCVFVCGMTERHFPQYHREDALLGDAERRRLGLSTAADRQREERFLFDFAMTRATERVVLSYPRFDEKGEPTLPSFFLPGGADVNVQTGGTREPGPLAYARGSVPPVPRTEPRPSGAEIVRRHAKLSPSSVESFRQCPFQFFASRTLRLRTRPPAPRDRLDIRVQGSILHRVLAEYVRAPLLGTALFAQVFEEECDKARVPRTYRTEAVRLELLHNFEAFLGDRQVSRAGWETRTEQKFEYALDTGLSIRGRMDRLEIGPARRAVVIDYKYSAPERIRDQVEQNVEGSRVQAGLYLAAAERALGLLPTGMLFCGVKKEITWGGWQVGIGDLPRTVTGCTNDFLRELIDTAEQAAVQAHDAILAGHMEVAPTDPKKCAHCDYRDMCRVESAGVDVVSERERRRVQEAAR